MNGYEFPGKRPKRRGNFNEGEEYRIYSGVYVEKEGGLWTIRDPHRAAYPKFFKTLFEAYSFILKDQGGAKKKITTTKAKATKTGAKKKITTTKTKATKTLAKTGAKKKTTTTKTKAAGKSCKNALETFSLNGKTFEGKRPVLTKGKDPHYSYKKARVYPEGGGYRVWRIGTQMILIFKCKTLAYAYGVIDAVAANEDPHCDRVIPH